MARKNPFASLLDDGGKAREAQPAVDYAMKGASRSILSSIDEMAARADKLIEGETIIDLDPDSSISPSFRTDFRRTIKSSASSWKQSANVDRIHLYSSGPTLLTRAATWSFSAIAASEPPSCSAVTCAPSSRR